MIDNLLNIIFERLRTLDVSANTLAAPSMG